MTAATFFEPDPVDPLERDRYDRPMLVPPSGGAKEPYTRASTLGGYLSDRGGLLTWQMRLLCAGLGQREDLTGMAAALPRLTGDKKADRETNAKLDEIIALACEIGGTHVKANIGTMIHSLCEPDSEGTVPSAYTADIASFKDLNLNVISSEQFVVNDTYRAAGSYDMLIELPDIGVVVADIKTGAVKPHDVAVQLAVYAGGVPYDVETNQRGSMTVNTDVALLIHIPAGQGVTNLYLVDLQIGRRAARVACWVRDYRQRKDILTDYTLASNSTFIPPWLQVTA